MKFHDSSFKMVRDTSFLKQSLKFVSKRLRQFGFFEFSKQVGLILKEESANVSKLDT